MTTSCRKIIKRVKCSDRTRMHYPTVITRVMEEYYNDGSFVVRYMN